MLKPNHFFSQKKFIIQRLSTDKTKIVFLPTIILLLKKDYGVQANIWGFILAWGCWQFEIGFGTVQEELFVHPLNYNGFLNWYKVVYKKNLVKEQIEDFLERNKDLKIFLERSGLDVHYPKVILGRALLKEYFN